MRVSHMAIGSGTTAAAAGDTALGTELGRVSTSTTVTSNEVAYVATFGGYGTSAVTEAGLFNASSAGDMLCRTVFSVVNKAADDSLQSLGQLLSSINRLIEGEFMASITTARARARLYQYRS